MLHVQDQVEVSESKKVKVSATTLASASAAVTQQSVTPLGTSTSTGRGKDAGAGAVGVGVVESVRSAMQDTGALLQRRGEMLSSTATAADAVADKASEYNLLTKKLVSGEENTAQLINCC